MCVCVRERERVCANAYVLIQVCPRSPNSNPLTGTLPHDLPMWRGLFITPTASVAVDMLCEKKENAIREMRLVPKSLKFQFKCMFEVKEGLNMESEGT